MKVLWEEYFLFHLQSTLQRYLTFLDPETRAALEVLQCHPARSAGPPCTGQCLHSCSYPGLSRTGTEPSDNETRTENSAELIRRQQAPELREGTKSPLQPLAQAPAPQHGEKHGIKSAFPWGAEHPCSAPSLLRSPSMQTPQPSADACRFKNDAFCHGYLAWHPIPHHISSSHLPGTSHALLRNPGLIIH